MNDDVDKLEKQLLEALETRDRPPRVLTWWTWWPLGVVTALAAVWFFVALVLLFKYAP